MASCSVPLGPPTPHVFVDSSGLTSLDFLAGKKQNGKCPLVNYAWGSRFRQNKLQVKSSIQGTLGSPKKQQKPCVQQPLLFLFPRPCFLMKWQERKSEETDL